VTHQEQQLPVVNDNPYIHDLVAADIQGRKEIGIERYKTGLQADNGRDALHDAYEEVLDQSVYLRQAIEERNLNLTQLRIRISEILDGAVQTKDLDEDVFVPILDAMVRATMPFVTTVNRPPSVRWHDASGETWEIDLGKPMQFPGGSGAFSLSFGEEKVDGVPQGYANPMLPVFEAACTSVKRTMPGGEPNLSPVMDALVGTGVFTVLELIEVGTLLRDAGHVRQRGLVYEQLAEERESQG
jgi:hypothetical protein